MSVSVLILSINVFILVMDRCFILPQLIKNNYFHEEEDSPV